MSGIADNMYYLLDRIRSGKLETLYTGDNQGWGIPNPYPF